MSRIKRLAKEGSWVVIGQIIMVTGSLILVRVLTEYLDPTQYGQLTLGLTIGSLVNQVVMGGLIASIGRHYSIAAEKRELACYFVTSCHLLAFATAAIVFIGLILFVGLYFLNYSDWMGLAAAALILSVLMGYNAALNSIQNAARQRAIVAFHNGLDAWLKIILVMGVVIWLGSSSTVVVVGYACSSLLITISQYIYVHRAILPKKTVGQYNHLWAFQIWSYSIPFTMWGVFTWLQQVSDRWALQVFSSTSDVGQYAVLYQLGFTPIALISGMVTSFIGPILYQRSGDAKSKERNANVHQLTWSITQLSLLTCLIAFLIAYIFHDVLFGLLVATEYREASYLLPWVMLAGGIFSSGQILALKLLSDMKPSRLTWAKIITALVGIALNIIGAFLSGIQGVVAAMIVFSVIYFIWASLLVGYAKEPHEKAIE